MKGRERIKNAMNFEKVDRLPWAEMYFDPTTLKWIEEGLPIQEIIVSERKFNQAFSNLAEIPRLSGLDPGLYFNNDRLFGMALMIDTGPIPRNVGKILEKNERYVKYFDHKGIVKKERRAKDTHAYSMPMHEKFPVTDSDSWDEYKDRLDPYDDRRYPKDWDGQQEDYIEIFEKYEKGATFIGISGLFGFGAQLMGIDRFCTMFYKDPELIRDMATHWEFFIIETIKEAVKTLEGRIDYIYWWEDMADKHGPLISPTLYEEFFLPHYKKVTGFLKNNGIDKIMMDSDGNLNPILDQLIEAGINGLWPLEVGAGMDAIEIRKKYGKKLFLAGNLDKSELAKGGEAMRNEVDSKIPELKRLGGYIAGCDHLPPPEFTFPKFQEYSDYLKSKL